MLKKRNKMSYGWMKFEKALPRSALDAEDDLRERVKERNKEDSLFTRDFLIMWKTWRSIYGQGRHAASWRTMMGVIHQVLIPERLKAVKRLDKRMLGPENNFGKLF